MPPPNSLLPMFACLILLCMIFRDDMTQTYVYTSARTWSRAQMHQMITCNVGERQKKRNLSTDADGGSKIFQHDKTRTCKSVAKQMLFQPWETKTKARD